MHASCCDNNFINLPYREKEESKTAIVVALPHKRMMKTKHINNVFSMPIFWKSTWILCKHQASHKELVLPLNSYALAANVPAPLCIHCQYLVGGNAHIPKGDQFLNYWMTKFGYSVPLHSRMFVVGRKRILSVDQCIIRVSRECLVLALVTSLPRMICTHYQECNCRGAWVAPFLLPPRWQIQASISAPDDVQRQFHPDDIVHALEPHWISQHCLPWLPAQGEKPSRSWCNSISVSSIPLMSIVF